MIIIYLITVCLNSFFLFFNRNVEKLFCSNIMLYHKIPKKKFSAPIKILHIISLHQSKPCINNKIFTRVETLYHR